MLRIEYQNKTLLKQRYLNVFSKEIAEMQESWDTHRVLLIKHMNMKESILPENIEDVLTGNFRSLATIYLEYCSKPKNSEEHQDLKELFRYTSQPHFGSGYQPKIAVFFMQNRYLIDLSTCYYCDMTYINVYDQVLEEDSDKEVISFLNFSGKEVLQNILGYAIDTIDDIITKRKEALFESGSDFDRRRMRRGIRYEQVKKMILEQSKNHFDLDHFLDKESCPIIGLSLFNFVPSCQVCNEKLKRSKVLGNTVDELCKCSPTCEEYRFNEEVKITLNTPLIPLSKEAAQRLTSLQFECRKGSAYENEIKVFRLNQRYNFHKEEALRMIGLKNRYSDSKIAEIAKLIYDGTEKAEQQVKEDLLGVEFKNTHHRCFRKMYNDLLKD